MSFFAHANLTSPSACHRIYPFYRATFLFFFYLYFSSSFFLSLFLFLFFFFSLSFFFFLSIFYFFIFSPSFSPSFPPLFIFGRHFRWREERNNKYLSAFLLIIIKIISQFSEIFNNRLLIYYFLKIFNFRITFFTCV